MPDESDHKRTSLSPKNPEDPWYFAEGAVYPSFGSTTNPNTPDSMVWAVFPDYYLRKDKFGRVVLDVCPSDGDHLLNPSIMNYERSMCRFLLENLIPDGLIGKKGTWEIKISFKEDE